MGLEPESRETCDNASSEDEGDRENILTDCGKDEVDIKKATHPRSHCSDDADNGNGHSNRQVAENVDGGEDQDKTHSLVSGGDQIRLGD